MFPVTAALPGQPGQPPLPPGFPRLPGLHPPVPKPVPQVCALVKVALDISLFRVALIIVCFELSYCWMGVAGYCWMGRGGHVVPGFPRLPGLLHSSLLCRSLVTLVCAPYLLWFQLFRVYTSLFAHISRPRAHTCVSGGLSELFFFFFRVPSLSTCAQTPWFSYHTLR